MKVRPDQVKVDDAVVIGHSPPTPCRVVEVSRGVYAPVMWMHVEPPGSDRAVQYSFPLNRAVTIQRVRE